LYTIKALINDRDAERLGVAFRTFVLSAPGNPWFAYEALKREDNIGTMLPCDPACAAARKKQGVAATGPVASMSAIDNLDPEAMAEHMRSRLRWLIEGLRGRARA
jgi:Domain of unknown function DUF302